MKLFALGFLAFTSMTSSLAFAETKGDAKKGEALFQMNCSTCHGPKGAGDGPAAAALNPKPRNLATDAFKAGDKPEEIFKTVSSGLPGTLMVGFGHIPEASRWDIVAFVKSLRKK